MRRKPLAPYEEPLQVTVTYGRRSRNLTIAVGAEYTVEPLNVQKLKHRGRRCVVTGFVRDDIGTPIKVKVRFLDNGRPGRVDIDDLKGDGLTRDSGPQAPAPVLGPGKKATLDLPGLEEDIETLFEMVGERIRKSEGSTDPDVAMEIMVDTVMMEGMGQLLQVIGRHIEEPDAKQRFVRMQQRFGGFKGASRGATAATTRRIQRLIPKH